MTARTYESPAAFKQAIEHRLRSSSETGVDFARRRQLLVFDRFLARVVLVLGETAVLKGGLGIELRLERARTTKDIDLRLEGPPGDVLERLQRAGRMDLGDFLAFEVRADPEHFRIQNEGMQYEGFRYRAEAKLAGKLYGQPFGVDVAFADPILGEPDTIIAQDVLGFAGIEPPALRVYPVESQIAEKLHVYTLPRDRENSRVKDLPDLALLAKVREIEAEQLRLALEKTFTYRKTHPIPTSVPEPPGSWVAVYSRIAAEDDLEWGTLSELVKAVRLFLDPVLEGTSTGRWSPRGWVWT